MIPSLSRSPSALLAAANTTPAGPGSTPVRVILSEENYPGQGSGGSLPMGCKNPASSPKPLLTSSYYSSLMADERFGGLTLINIPVNSVALATLAARTPIALVTGFDAMTAAFLVKRVRYWLYITGVTANNGPFAAAIGPGDATQAEAALAVTVANTVGPNDMTLMNAQDGQYNVFQNSFDPFILPGDGGTRWQTMGQWISLGKGLPFPEGGGLDAWLFNLDDAALDTGAVVRGLIQIQGVWLGS